MTWQTEMGERILEGIEAKLYLQALQEAVFYLQDVEEFGDELECPTGDNLFDNASFNQKIVLLHSCVSALLKPEVPSPELTNVMEAAAFFPFAFLLMKVEEEVSLAEDSFFEEDEDGLKYYYRQLVWQALEELVLPNWQTDEDELEEDEEEEDGWSDFNYLSTDVEQWELFIDTLADRIFWDRDWQIPSQFPQLLDGIEAKFSPLTGIDEDYITNRLPKVSLEQAKSSLFEIQNWGQSYLE